MLEKLAEIGKIDAFFEAVDSDDFSRARRLMKKAGVSSEEIGLVLRMMKEAG